MKQNISKIYITQLFLLIVCVVFSVSIFAKQNSASHVLPIQYHGIEYRTIKWSHENGTKQNGGYIEAIRISDGKKMWGCLIYKTKYIRGLEKDVQDIFIKSMYLGKTKEYLVVTNEKNEIFYVNLKDGKSKKQ